jgi:hypothetical protein
MSDSGEGWRPRSKKGEASFAIREFANYVRVSFATITIERMRIMR